MDDFIRVLLIVILLILFYFAVHGLRKFTERMNVENEKVKSLLETVIALSFVFTLPFLFFVIYGIKNFNS